MASGDGTPAASKIARKEAMTEQYCLKIYVDAYSGVPVIRFWEYQVTATTVRRHRGDGYPAMIRMDGTREWAVNGIRKKRRNAFE